MTVMTTTNVFVCTNIRRTPLSCGLRCDAARLACRLEQRLRESGQPDVDVRVRQTRCLGRCPSGPVIGIYPANVWYHYVDEHDIDELVEEHFVRGRAVDRLRLRPPAPLTAHPGTVADRCPPHSPSSD